MSLSHLGLALEQNRRPRLDLVVVVLDAVGQAKAEVSTGAYAQKCAWSGPTDVSFSTKPAFLT